MKSMPKIIKKMKKPNSTSQKIKMKKLIINSIFPNKSRISLSRHQGYLDISGRYLNIHFYS
jgi:hypothetical protein